MQYDKCKRCGKAIVWARTQHGKAVPLDPKALVFSVASERGQLIAVSLTGHVGPTGDQMMVSHFATCPFADEFSGKNRNTEPAPVSGQDAAAGL